MVETLCLSEDDRRLNREWHHLLPAEAKGKSGPAFDRYCKDFHCVPRLKVLLILNVKR